MRFALLVTGCVACGGGGITEPVNVVAPIPEGAVEVGEVLVCGDPVLNDQLTTGGQRVTTWQPCFDVGDEAAVDQRQQVIASYDRQLENRENEVDRALPLDTLAACAGVPLAEQGHSPFAHRASIDRVEPVHENGELVGVRVVFQPVRGLTADWLRRDIACQQARWDALGNVATWRPDDPTLVEGATTTVLDRAGHVEVIITVPSPEQAHVALVRARESRAQQAAR